MRKVIGNMEQSIAEHRRDLDVQFSRIAQLQAELDRLKKRTQPAHSIDESPSTPAPMI
jgi:hypothetical protein